MQKILDKISRAKHIQSELGKLSRMIDRLEEYRENPDKKIRSDGYMKLFDMTGNKPVSIDIAHLVGYTSQIIELLKHQYKVLEEELTEIQEVLSVTDRLFDH